MQHKLRLTDRRRLWVWRRKKEKKIPPNPSNWGRLARIAFTARLQRRSSASPLYAADTVAFAAGGLHGVLLFLLNLFVSVLNTSGRPSGTARDMIFIYVSFSPRPTVYCVPVHANRCEFKHRCLGKRRQAKTSAASFGRLWFSTRFTRRIVIDLRSENLGDCKNELKVTNHYK